MSAMMFLILVLCAASVFFFIKTYKKEMREKRLEHEKKTAQTAAATEVEREDAAS